MTTTGVGCRHWIMTVIRDWQRAGMIKAKSTGGIGWNVLLDREGGTKCRATPYRMLFFLTSNRSLYFLDFSTSSYSGNDLNKASKNTGSSNSQQLRCTASKAQG
ncbi:unnamed protein product [Zymoseptoria tritici ST99CH_3D1]|uniref:DUF7770 domain-containing protein n=1 Tax=Zymoseptoria tritici (strain ST99CH_3D7) TaxID=1276538 RepID=A0A1X7RXQ4_ZYMT9|nr:unnamed protein product [Zymoseptoria tritici ST99CH_3D7]SMR57366.1 unnamed protein product [Zymoseptoria tritici ST99CH_3D1]